MNNKDKLEITVLGCGGSGGLPYPNGFWGKADPNEPKNRRTRPSIFIKHGNTQVLVDTSPDLRQQLLSLDNWNGLLDGVIYTHAHADHINGIDDLRAIRFAANKPVDIYSNEETISTLRRRFDYCFEQQHWNYPPLVEPHVIPNYTQIELSGLKIDIFAQYHDSDADMTTLGLRIGDFAYCTDVVSFPEKSYERLKGVKTLVLDCLYLDAELDIKTQLHPNKAHVMEWVEDLKPDMTYLTHLNHHADYQTICEEMPDYIRPAYDGLKISVDMQSK